MAHKIEIYSKKPLFKRRNYYWRCRFTQGKINNIVAIGGEGYNNLEDLEASLHHFLTKGVNLPFQYIDPASQAEHERIT